MSNKVPAAPNGNHPRSVTVVHLLPVAMAKATQVNTVENMIAVCLAAVTVVMAIPAAMDMEVMVLEDMDLEGMVPVDTDMAIADTKRTRTRTQL